MNLPDVTSPSPDLGFWPDAGLAPEVGPDVPAAPADAGMVTLSDGGPVQCRAAMAATGCTPIPQLAPNVDEMQMATAPPMATAGWYPAGSYNLTSATVYTGPGGASGPSGQRYAETLEVHGMGSVDYFQVVHAQAGCAAANYTFSADTFNATSQFSALHWMCPACPTCGTTMPFTGTLTSLVLYFPLANGNTLGLTYAVVAR